MKIACKPLDSYGKFLMIQVDEEPWKKVSTSIFGKNPQFPDYYCSLQEWEERFLQWETKAVTAYVVKLLSQRSYSTFQLQKKLGQLHVAEEVRQKVIDECVRRGFVNDRTWIDNFVRQQKAKRVGPQLIAAKLRAKGIPTDLLEEETNEEESVDSICHLLKTRYSKRNLKDPKERQKVIAALARKGFSFDSIRISLKKS